MATNEVPVDTGLIEHCKRINEELGKVLTLTIEIGGQHHDDESKVAGLDAKDTLSDLLGWIQALSLKADNLVAQLEYMKEQF